VYDINVLSVRPVYTGSFAVISYNSQVMFK